MSNPLFPQPPAHVLCEGFHILIQLLLYAEADFLCGAYFNQRSAKRLNYRCGFHKRMIKTILGDISIGVPHLKYIHPRVPIPKCAQRLSQAVLDLLSHIFTFGVNRGHAAALIRSLWTMEISDPLIEKLTTNLLPLLAKWRSGAFDPRELPGAPGRQKHNRSKGTNGHAAARNQRSGASGDDRQLLVTKLDAI